MPDLSEQARPFYSTGQPQNNEHDSQILFWGINLETTTDLAGLSALKEGGSGERMNCLIPCSPLLLVDVFFFFLFWKIRKCRAPFSHCSLRFMCWDGEGNFGTLARGWVDLIRNSHRPRGPRLGKLGFWEPGWPSGSCPVSWMGLFLGMDFFGL